MHHWLGFCPAASLFHRHQGKIVAIFNEYFYLGKGSSIHSSGQMELFKVNVCDKSIKGGGKQHIQTLKGHTLPSSIKNGLAYLKCLGDPTASYVEKYPHVMFMNGIHSSWIMSSLRMKSHPCLLETHLISLGPQSTTYLMSMESSISKLSRNLISSWMPELIQIQGSIKTSPQFTFKSETHPPDFKAMCPLFGWTSADSIQDTFKVTTRYGTAPPSYDYLKNHLKARNLSSTSPVVMRMLLQILSCLTHLLW